MRTMGRAVSSAHTAVRSMRRLLEGAFGVTSTSANNASTALIDVSSSVIVRVAWGLSARDSTRDTATAASD